MLILYGVLIYFVTGILFAVVFVTKLIHVVDESSAGSPWSFRLIIFPGCVVFWPVLLRKYLKVQQRK
ncbi:MAG: hypothetical protein C0490_09285 [Marivirga sp.]|nr:hypothetical protein [Marivirga sp.]